MNNPIVVDAYELEVKIEQMRKELLTKGLNKEEIKRVLDPIESFYLGVLEEAQSLERG